jgi:hypothetical protein
MEKRKSILRVDHLLHRTWGSAELKNCACKAKKSIHHVPEGDQIVYSDPYNHSPPIKQKTRPEVKNNVVTKLEAGAKPSVIHKQLVVNHQGPVTRKDILLYNKSTIGSTNSLRKIFQLVM